MARRNPISFPSPDHDHRRCRREALAAADDLCASRGARLTPLRRRVLELIWSGHAPSGAYALLDRLREDGLADAPPTVYRALDFLLEQGLIHRIESRNAYIGCAHPESAHGAEFMICTACGAAMEIAGGPIGRAVEASARELGFSVARPTVEIEGTCAACLRAERERPA